MSILKDSVVIPLNRPLFIPKEDDLTIDDIIIESNGDYRLIDQPDYIIVKNNHCCRGIQVTVKKKE